MDGPGRCRAGYAVELAGDVSLEAAADCAGRLAVGGAPGNVGVGVELRGLEPLTPRLQRSLAVCFDLGLCR
jgi:hypothetical protein